MSGRFTGAALKRREDPRLLRGQGRFIADITPAGTLHVSIVRSPYAHARIRAVETGAARSHPGVVAVLSAADLGEVNKPLPNRFPHAALNFFPQYPLAREKVNYVGEPVAVVLATDRYVAEDAAELVSVDYEPLPAVADMEAAVRPGAPVVHGEAGAADNVAAALTQRVGDAAAAIAQAHMVVKERLVIKKCGGIPMECRGLIARVDPGGTLVVWDSTQTPHMIRDIMAELLGLPQHKVRVIPPDVGGAFGVKEPFYPEDFLIPYLALRTGCPVKWVEDRRENLLASIQERGQVHDAELAVDTDGRILAVRDNFVADTGAYTPWGIIVPVITSTMIQGPYKVPAYECRMTVAYTNTCPLAPYRGAGRPQAVFVMERLLDRAAEALHIDRAEIRRRNFIQPHEFPYKLGLLGRDGAPMQYDSGDYPACLQRALDLIEYDRFPAEQAVARAEGRLLGIGIACGIENNGLGPHEGARIRVEPSGRIVLYTGACSQGQGHETTWAQLAADELGVSPDDVDVVGGDTDGIPFGVGTFASRSAINAGNAILAAGVRLREKALNLASHLLEAEPGALELKDGAVQVKSAPDRRIGLGQLAFYASGSLPGRTFPTEIGIGLEVTEYFVPPAPVYSNGAHAAVVEVDPGTGHTKIVRYAMVHDCGNMINPLVVEGQILGGFVAGIGNALYEEVAYSEDGQLLTGSFMDYLIPTAMEVPDVIRTDHVTSPSPFNPLGVKGVGENGTIPVPACINSAVQDAVGGCFMETPLSPGKIRQMLRSRAN